MDTQKDYADIAEAINDIVEEINSTLDDCKKEKYFGGIVLLYSFIENLLKWLVFAKLLWEINRILSDEEIKTLRQFCKRLTFYNAQHVALAVSIIDWRLFKRLDAIRQQRNDVIHQLWLYAHRSNNLVLRKNLEKLAGVASDLVQIFNRSTQEIGVEEVYEVFLWDD